ncbi:hypothetical protein JOC95_003826 [Bacillus tianshenii]|uniref:ACT domain-containing protein n=1 Tax=Sutcliffiella tianshenii TaxID=1463404 RepID=A0ABS2P4Q0_9BACI|nr:hypothetical protein [Bacillus tianshenii]MBM7621918.1 hypothetical protein [Bacillus tianshenii]
MTTNNNDSFDYLLRTQFSFTADDPALANLLKGIADQKININAFAQLKGNDTNYVRLVVGSSEAEAPIELQSVRRILRSLKIRFQEKQVIQIIRLRAGRAGQIDDIYSALWCKVEVRSIYIGEKTNVYVDSTDLDQVIAILSSENIEPCS